MLALKPLDRTDILRLAAESQLDPRTVRRAILKGVQAIKAEVDRARLRAAAKRLRLSIE